MDVLCQEMTQREIEVGMKTSASGDMLFDRLLKRLELLCH